MNWKSPLLAAALLSVARSTGWADTYNINIQAGDNLIANHLDTGNNNVNQIIPSAPGSSQLRRYDNAAGTFGYEVFDDVDLLWLPGTTQLHPGEGAIFHSPVAFTLTMNGAPHVPVLPITLRDGFNLVSCQTNKVASYEEIVGVPPEEGTELYRFSPGPGRDAGNLSPPHYTLHTFSGGAWSPGPPSVAIGESVWIKPNCAPKITLQPLDYNVTECDCVTFRVTAVGKPTLVYQWYFNGAPLVGATNNTFTLCPVTLADAGSYHVIITNSCGSVTSRVATLTVSPNFTPPVLICSTNITVAGTEADGGAVVDYQVTATNGCGPVTLSCFPPAGSLFPCGTTTVTCDAFDNNGLGGTNCSFTVTVHCACLELLNEQITCATNLPGALLWTFGLENNTGVPIKYLYLVPKTNCFTFTPGVLTLTPPLAPGQTTNGLSALITVTGPCASSLCFLVSAHDANFAECCTLMHCVDRTPPVPAKLEISDHGGMVHLSWPCGYILECATSLSPPAVWMTATNQSNPQWFVPMGAHKFFRLKAP